MARRVAALLALLCCRGAGAVHFNRKARSPRGLDSYDQLRYPPPGQDCDERHDADLYRNITLVLREHPAVDGNCWFHFYADYLGDPPSYADQFRGTVAQFTPRGGGGPPITLHLTTGEDLYSHADGIWGSYPYDDAMCYQMGWMKGQRLDEHVMKLRDREAWLDLSEAECQRLPEMVRGPLNSTKLTIGYMQDDNVRVMIASECLRAPPGSSSCERATLEDYAYHLYPKCLLGGERLTGAAGQIAWCLARACVTEGNVIRHGMECWPEGLPF